MKREGEGEGKGRGRKQNAMAMVCRASLVFAKSRGSSGSAIRAAAVPPEKVATNDTTSQVSLRLSSSTSSSVQSQLVLMRHGKHSYKQSTQSYNDHVYRCFKNFSSKNRILYYEIS